MHGISHGACCIAVAAVSLRVANMSRGIPQDISRIDQVGNMESDIFAHAES
jgi:hypothetical protein